MYRVYSLFYAVPSLLALIGVGLLPLSLCHCGGSLRALQESTEYFEQCYSADFDPLISSGEKEDCWQAWVEHYRVAPQSERALYAAQRISEIRRGLATEHLPGLTRAELRAGVGSRFLSSTAAEALLANEVQRADATDASMDSDETVSEETQRLPARERRRRRPPMPRTNNPRCAALVFEADWRACADACPPEREGCLQACEMELQTLSQGCF